MLRNIVFFCEEEGEFIDTPNLQKSPEQSQNYKEVLLSSSFDGNQDERETRRCRSSSSSLGSTKSP
jgi:hypothetical protein